LDPRVKTLLMLLAVLTALGGSLLQLAALCLYLALQFRVARIALRRFGRELLVFALLAALILLPPALEGRTAAGAVSAWRFLTVVAAGLLFTATTAPRELHGTARWLLRPLPGVREGAAATHISLTLLFIPLLFDTFAEIREARRARCAEGNRKPLLRIRGITTGLLEKLFEQIGEVACALESRCYREDARRVRLLFDRRQRVRSLLFLLPYPLIALLPAAGGEIPLPPL
jgi:energy-coupling factor transporter transmembrane protein EcfT